MGKIKENLKVKGTIQIFVNGILAQAYENFLTSAGADLILQALSGVSISKIDYFAIDNGAGTYSIATAALNNEIFRKQVTSSAIDGTKLVFDVFIGDAEAIDTWTGIGLSNGATLGAGIFTNLRNVNFVHNNGDEVSIVWTLEVLV